MKIKTSRTGLEIAVIGLAGTFPGAANAREFWQNLWAGRGSISPLSDEELLAAGVHPQLLTLSNFVRAKGVFPSIEYFDAAFFDYTPRDAALMDPQVRALHQCVYHVLEDAGYAGHLSKGSIGLFVGASGNFVWELSTRLDTKESAASQFATLQLNDKDFVATRIAYKLNLRGPCAAVHSACSTSLYAVDLACRQLLTGACSMAVAAGSGLNLPHKNGYVYEEGMILSPDGLCRPFSDDSNGTLEGNGMGAVVLKPLEHALRDHDRILAVIKGTGANNDGARKVGYTAPSVEGQAEVIRRALHMAEVEPESISYVEAHGTGTALGDPVEIEGLKKAFRTERTGFCGIGSLKSNIGHLDAAAGISSFIKTVLALQHRRIPPSLNFRAANPEIDFAHSPFYVVDHARDWVNPAVDGSAYEVYPLRAGVSSFGIGGTNVHVVLEEAPELPASTPGREWKLLCLSGADAAALERVERVMTDYLLNRPELDLADCAYTLQVGRRSLPQRRALAFRHRDDLLHQLRAEAGSAEEIGARRYLSPAQPPRLVFLLAGQGTQYPGMALGLVRSEPVFRETLERCLGICDSHGLTRVRSLLMNATPDAGDIAALNDTELAQPSVFAVEYALASLLMDWGIQPAAMIGHSLGEYVAACLAGVMSLEHALPLVIKRARLMHELPSGAMLAVAASPADLASVLPPGLDLAAVNGPRQCTVSGAHGLIEEFERALHASSVPAKRLHTSHAFHSSLMEPMLPALRAALEEVTLAAPCIPYLSNLSGEWITPEQAQDPNYYTAHTRGTVRFSDGAQKVLAEPNTLYVELGPGQVLGAFVKQCASEHASVTVSVLRHARADVPDTQHLVRALGELWGHGVQPDWKRYYRHEVRSKVEAPLYPFAPHVFPIGRGDIYRLLESVGAPAAVSVTDATAVMTLGWQSALLPALDDSAVVRACLGIMEGGHYMRRTRKALHLVSGLRVIECEAAHGWADEGGGRYTADLERTTDWRRLLHALRAADGVPGLMVWLSAAREPQCLRVLLQRVLRLARVLRSESPNHAARLVLALPGLQRRDADVDAELDACLRSLRADFPQLDLRAVLGGGGLKPTQLAERLEREIYDPDTLLTLAVYDQGRRAAYRTAALTAPGAPACWAGRTVGLLGPAGLPLREFATRIERASAARVIPISAYWQEARPTACALNVSPRQIRELLARDQMQDLRRHGLRELSDAHALLDEACTTLVARYVDGCLPLTPGRSFTREVLRAALRVTPRLEKYVDCILAMLSENRVLEPGAGGYTVRRAPAELREVAAIRHELAQASPLFTGNLDVVEHCVAAFPAALPEQVPPISVLYPDGSNSMLENAYKGSIQELEERVIRITFENLFKQIVQRARGPIRILEAGGGFGLTMRRLAPLLRGVKVEYYFTDIGRTFLHDAREFALREGYDFLTFGIFDLNRPPQEQGLELNSFDMVFAFNVVHATRSLTASVGHLRRLLRDGGLMCLLERTRVRRYIDLIWGLADGWWHFDEQERKLSPLTDLDQWEAVARAAGFADVISFPADASARRCLETGILVAQTPAAPQPIADAALEGWRIEVPGAALDGVIVLDVARDRPPALFEPYGEQLLASHADAGSLWPAALSWLQAQRPGFVSLWSGGQALSHAPDQLVQAIACGQAQRQIRALPGGPAGSQLYLPLALRADGSAQLPDTAQLEQALGVVAGGLERAVLGASRLDLFALPPAHAALRADDTMQAIKLSSAIDASAPEQYQSLLHTLWAELFGIERIGLDEDFFELGGDSLKVAQLTAELEKHGVKLMPNEVFNHPTLRLLARYLHLNRQEEHGDVRNVPDLLARLRQTLGAEAELHTVQHEGRSIRVLFLGDTAFDQRPLLVLARLRLPAELQPHYVVPLSRCPAQADEVEAAEMWRAIGLADSDADARAPRLVEQVARDMRRLHALICQGPVQASYPLSPFQKMFLKESNRVTFYMIDFDEPIEVLLLERALTDVVSLQGLLRSRLRRNLVRRLVWDEFAAPSQPLALPLVDLSDCAPPLQGELVERLMAVENRIDFNATGGVMFRVMLMRLDRCRHTLFFNLDHSIFDNMSGQVLRRQLLTRYRQLLAGNTAPMAPVKSFRDYLEQINRGPQGITKQKLLEIFELPRYQKAKNAVEERILARRQPQIRKLRYALDLDLYQISDDDDATWEITLMLLAYTLARFLEQDAVPLKIVYQGRQYQDLSYFDTLGLFIDVLPLLVMIDRDDPGALIEGLRRKIRFVNRYNVNFMNMLMNVAMRFKWWDALAPMNARKLGRRDPMILLNYVGKAEAEYQKVIDFSTRQMEGASSKDGYASLYVIVTRVDRTIQFDVFCNFERDIGVLQRLFEEEAARLFKRAARDSACET